MLEKADSNKDGKVSFEDFYSVMIKDIYWEIERLLSIWL
jgi:Ca2+-binding EF-hand superfamily protein